ncbi:hypothetical protein [Dysgonomonas sp. 25]|uniref:hypothetical protein n=1 Tax=Dysgonomonas sp. 25 TaxID=2302933 RepID=UPI0013CFEC78|nr:hypothetical protein [Dysgonomonas sp. 25]NDV68279.1 hypothetical protein [Dysgonomonas sp. 25]
MSRDNWYRNTIWNEDIEHNFEERLKRSRGSFYKAQYIRIQATYLLRTESQEYQTLGIELLKRTISEYPNEILEVTCALEQIGDYYMKKKELDEAKYYFELINKYKNYKQNADNLSNLKLIEIVLRKNEISKFSIVYEQIENINIEDLIFNSDKFYFTYLAACLSHKMGKLEVAKKYASLSQKLLENNNPQFKKHPNVGIIKPTNNQLKELESILNS